MISTTSFERLLDVLSCARNEVHISIEDYSAIVECIRWYCPKTRDLNKDEKQCIINKGFISHFNPLINPVDISLWCKVVICDKNNRLVVDAIDRFYM